MVLFAFLKVTNVFTPNYMLLFLDLGRISSLRSSYTRSFNHFFIFSHYLLIVYLFIKLFNHLLLFYSVIVSTISISIVVSVLLPLQVLFLLLYSLALKLWFFAIILFSPFFSRELLQALIVYYDYNYFLLVIVLWIAL